MAQQDWGDTGEVGSRLDLGELAAVEDGQGDRRVFSAGVAAEEERVLADEGVDAQGALPGRAVGPPNGPPTDPDVPN